MKKRLVIVLFLALSIVYSQGATCNDTRVYILDNGHVECDANWMVAGTVVATEKVKNPPAKWIQIPCSAALIDHPDGNPLRYR